MDLAFRRFENTNVRFLRLLICGIVVYDHAMSGVVTPELPVISSSDGISYACDQ